MKKTAIVLFIILFSGFAAAQESVWFKGTFEEAKANAKQENKLILIDFYSDG